MSRSPNRHAQRKAITHQRLIDAARALIVEKGYTHVDILDITERANLSKATFYQHFANKEACVRELMQQGFDALLEQVLSTRPPNALDSVWIIDSLAMVFAWAEQNRELLLIMVGGAATSRLNVFGRNYMVEVVERTLLGELADLQPARRHPPAIQAQVLTGVVIQMLGWWLEHDTGYSARQMGELIHDILQHGLGPLTAR